MFTSAISGIIVSVTSCGKQGNMSRMTLSDRIEIEAGIYARKSLNEIAEQGACVIVGQTANFILRNNPNVVRVFLYAPEEFRINTLQQKHSVSAQEARKMLTISDTSRAATTAM